jgi:hypothetical protein
MRPLIAHGTFSKFKRCMFCLPLLGALCAAAIAQSQDQNGSPAHTTSSPDAAATATQKERATLNTRPSVTPLSIYIDAPPDAQPIKKEILAKLRSWGEITIVNLPEQSDLILQLDQSGKLNALSGSGNRGSVVLKNRRTGEELWAESRGGAWSMRGWSNASVGRKLGDDLIQFLVKNQSHIDRTEPSKHE